MYYHWQLKFFNVMVSYNLFIVVSIAVAVFANQLKSMFYAMSIHLRCLSFSKKVLRGFTFTLKPKLVTEVRNQRYL